MDPVSRSLNHNVMDPDAGNDAVADLKGRLGALQIGGGGDMLIDPYDPVDEKEDVAIITPDDPMDEPEPEPEPLADDYDAMRARTMIPMPELEIAYEGQNTWNIENYRGLNKKERGPIFEVGGHPWRILLFPFGNNVEFASFYLEHGYEDPQPEDWYACVQFALVLWNKNDPSIYVHHTASHRFCADEGDWGFTRFAELRKFFAAQWEDKGKPMVENDAVNVTAYVRIYKDPTGVLWHNFVNYDSKKQTGMVGLKNQGATCYLNSLLQSLYFTNAFRKAVYQIPTEHDALKSNSAWALQRLFYLLQTYPEAVGTQELTASFGWETKQIFEQQDVQELSRILMEKLEIRMKGTEAENALAKMFVGKMKTYISCINVDYESSRIEDFWDIQLNVSGNKNLDDSFKDYIQVETMDGENKYFAEGYGLQDVKKGVIFESFPQVLHLQLKRFDYDINREATLKVNDRYEFPETFDAAPYLSENADKSEPYVYQLHGVLVHSGDFNAGHYYAFLRPTKDGPFYKFDDDRVTRASLNEALEANFGGDYSHLTNGDVGVRNPYSRTISTKRSMSAYMLVYIRQSRIDNILLPVSESDTPEHLAIQLNKERTEMARKRKEREEAHLYLSIGILTEENFKAHQGFDLTNWDTELAQNDSSPKTYRVLKTSTVGNLTETLAEERKLPAELVRLWVMVNRQNKTIRPDQPLMELGMTIDEAWNKFGSREKPFRFWLETSDPPEDGKPIWPNVQLPSGTLAPILIHLKYFDADAQTLKGVGHVYMKRQAKVADLVPAIQQKMGWSPGATPQLTLYEEIKHSMIEPMKSKSTLQQAEIQDGDIVCFQRVLSDKEAALMAQSGAYTDAREFYDYLLNKIVVHFSPKTAVDAEKEMFDLTLNRKMSYDQFSAKVGEYLKIDPTHIRFSTVNATTGKSKAIVRRIANQTLAQILHPQYSTYNNNNQRTDALYYEIMDMSLSEMETKKILKIAWVSEGVSKEELFDILVPKQGVVGDIFPGLQKKAGLNEEVMPNIRIYEAHNGRVYKELSREHSVTVLNDYSTLYAEEIPEEERKAQEGDKAIFVFHFDKEPNRPHSIPFKFLVKPGEPFTDTKERLMKRTGIKAKQFEKVKFALVPRPTYSRPTYLKDDDILSNMALISDDLGLDHVNRTRAVGGKGDSIFIR